MTDESTKTVIRVIQDLCFGLNIDNFVLEFSKYIAKQTAIDLSEGRLTLNKLASICKHKLEFFYANDLDVDNFCKKLLKSLQKEFSFDENEDELFVLLKEYKFKMEGGNLQGFPGGTKEDALRSDLANYLPYKDCYCEPRCSSGRCDIIIPVKKAIIETKIWSGQETYSAGIVELSEYLKSKNFSSGYYVIFNYNFNPNKIMKTKGEFFIQKYNKLKIYTVFIQMNKIPPSHKYKNIE